jgi:hypothetical protein
VIGLFLLSNMAETRMQVQLRASLLSDATNRKSKFGARFGTMRGAWSSVRILFVDIETRSKLWLRAEF